MNYCIIETNLGFVGLLGENGILTASTLPCPTLQSAYETLTAGLSVSFVEDEPAFGDLPARLRRYFVGERVDFSDVKVDVSSYGAFQAAVIRETQKIPYGEMVTYSGLARSAGNEKAARAAGSAMANNRTPIIVPCHRVIASDGTLGGFAGGLDMKRDLLKMEGVDI